MEGPKAIIYYCHVECHESNNESKFKILFSMHPTTSSLDQCYQCNRTPAPAPSARALALHSASVPVVQGPLRMTRAGRLPRASRYVGRAEWCLGENFCRRCSWRHPIRLSSEAWSGREDAPYAPRQCKGTLEGCRPWHGKGEERSSATPFLTVIFRVFRLFLAFANYSRPFHRSTPSCHAIVPGPLHSACNKSSL